LALNAPQLLEPLVEIVLVDAAEVALLFGRLAVSAGLAAHEDEAGVGLEGCVGPGCQPLAVVGGGNLALQARLV
jgi:hypothetical protein